MCRTGRHFRFVPTTDIPTSSIPLSTNRPDAIVPHTRTSTPSPDSRVVTFKAARNNRAYEFSSGELAEQAPRGKKINSFKAFGEPVVNPFQQLDGLPLAALIGP